MIIPLAAASIGCHGGLTGRRRPLVAVAFVLIISVVMALIWDPDHPRRGSLKVSQQALVDLRGTMSDPAPESKIARGRIFEGNCEGMFMQMHGLLDVSIWVLFVATLLIAVLSFEVGFRSAGACADGTEQEVVVRGLVGGMLGLLAFMLAFTFGVAATRFDARGKPPK